MQYQENTKFIFEARSKTSSTHDGSLSEVHQKSVFFLSSSPNAAIPLLAENLLKLSIFQKEICNDPGNKMDKNLNWSALMMIHQQEEGLSGYARKAKKDDSAMHQTLAWTFGLH